MSRYHAINNFECELTTEETEVTPTGMSRDTTYSPHNTSYGFCTTDPTCPCHEDENLIADVMADYEAGLLSEEDATDITMGRTL